MRERRAFGALAALTVLLVIGTAAALATLLELQRMMNGGVEFQGGDSGSAVNWVAMNVASQVLFTSTPPLAISAAISVVGLLVVVTIRRLRAGADEQGDQLEATAASDVVD